MTIREAIYCMKSYLPDNEAEACLKCTYYASICIEDGFYTCRSDEAHRMAILALEKMMEDV